MSSSLSRAGSDAVTAKAQWGEMGGCCEADNMPTSRNSAQGSAGASFSPCCLSFPAQPKGAASSPASGCPNLQDSGRVKERRAAHSLIHRHLKPSLLQSPVQFLINNVLPPRCTTFEMKNTYVPGTNIYTFH